MTKGGRQRKGERECRIDHLNVRLTTRERANLDAEARRLGMPNIDLCPAVDRQRRFADRHNILAASYAAIVALIRVGNNLNQLARYAHAKSN